MKTRRMSTLPGFALASAALLLAAIAQAGPPDDHGGWRHGPPGAEMQLAKLDRELNLSDEQSVQLLEILQAAEVERAELHARVMEQMRPEVCALMQGTEAEILAILTPEQAVEFAELKADRQDRFARHRKHDFAMPDCDASDD